MIRNAVLAALALVCATLPVEARQHHVPGAERSCIPTGDVMRPCVYQPNFMAGVRSIKVTMHRERHAEVAPEVVAHPAGCPARAFCGCGAAIRVFGHSIRELWLAANWFKFPRAAPAPGMAAVRRHHVFVLEVNLGGGVWQVFDANSGHHLTRVHARSIAGFVIVNPHGAG